MSNKDTTTLINIEEVEEMLHTLEARQAQAYTNFMNGVTNLSNQYATQSQIIFELAAKILGQEPSEMALHFEKLMAEETEKQELLRQQQQEAQADSDE